MKKFLPLIFTVLTSAALCACNCVDSAAPAASAESQNVSANAGKRKIGIALYTLRTHTIAEIVELLKDMQVDAIGLSTTPLGGGFDGVYTTPDMTPEQKAYLKKLLADNGIKIASYGVRSPQTEAEIRKMLAFAKEMEIPLVLTESQGKALEIWNRVAPEYGVKVALHNHAYNRRESARRRYGCRAVQKSPEGKLVGVSDNHRTLRARKNTGFDKRNPRGAAYPRTRRRTPGARLARQPQRVFYIPREVGERGVRPQLHFEYPPPRFPDRAGGAQARAAFGGVANQEDKRDGTQGQHHGA